MLDEKSVFHLESSLRRIFAMKVTRSTFRELQNTVVSIAQGDRDTINNLFETLFTGTPKDALTSDPKVKDQLKEICRNFSVLVRLTKEIFERGEFVNIITSDLITQEKEVAFLNRIRRIDGDEFMFITDPASTVHLLQHFYGRLEELDRSPEGKNQLGQFKKDLVALSTKLNALAADLTEVRTV
jgi:hypothetical protein